MKNYMKIFLGEWSNPLDLTFGWCWQASCCDAPAIQDEAHVQKHSSSHVRQFTCQHGNARTRGAQSAHTAIERSASLNAHNIR